MNPSHSPTDQLPLCDLVMKGGITSGIVYPPAVLELSRRYRFRQIGGTSAGAIAAAVTAAAECGRETGGFGKLAKVNQQLATGTFLRDLFQPSPRAQPLLDAGLDALAQKDKLTRGGTVGRAAAVGRVVLSLLRHYAEDVAIRGSLIGGAAGTAAALGAGVAAAVAHRLVQGGWAGAGQMLVWAAILTAAVLVPLLGWAGKVLGSVGDVANFFAHDVGEQGFFGLCSGSRYPDDQRPSHPVLTDWLHGVLNDLAGLSNERPLTFGDLDQAPGGPVRLRMITSNLSQALPFVLPFAQRFLYRVDEFQRLFPEPVMRHLEAVAHQSTRVAPPEGYRFFPDEKDFPVVVAARMSLSFPLLISAVPLYAVSRDAFARKQKDRPLNVTEAELQRNLFSDGGIASNFPIHFFDDWFPGHPTFGITLDTVAAPPAADLAGRGEGVRSANLSVVRNVPGNPDEAMVPAGGDDPRILQSVYLPRANDPLAPAWTPVNGVGSFLGAIFSTAQNYRDTLQGLLPSYRERVVTVRLASDEGGLNLAMDAAAIASVMAKGQTAGVKLRDEFRFEHHQWVRLRVLMAQIEANLDVAAKVLGTGLNVESLAARAHAVAADGERFPYPARSDEWVRKAVERVEQLQQLARQWQDEQVFTPDAPRPEPVLSIVPDV